MSFCDYFLITFNKATGRRSNQRNGFEVRMKPYEIRNVVYIKLYCRADSRKAFRLDGCLERKILFS